MRELGSRPKRGNDMEPKRLHVARLVALGLVLVFVTGVLLLFVTKPHFGVYDSAMEPKIARGSEVFVRSQQRYEAGDIVVVRTPSGMAVRQLTTVDQYTETVRTKALAFPKEDAWARELTTADIVGGVLFTVPRLGNILDGGFWGAIIRNPGSFFGIKWWLLAAVALVLATKVKLRANERRHRRGRRSRWTRPVSDDTAPTLADGQLTRVE